MRVRALVRAMLPGAAEEVHPPTKMIGFTYRPGTYKHLVRTVSPQKTYVNVRTLLAEAARRTPR